MKKTTILLLTLFLFSCGENNKSMETENLDSLKTDTIIVEMSNDTTNSIKHELPIVSDVMKTFSGEYYLLSPIDNQIDKNYKMTIDKNLKVILIGDDREVLDEFNLVSYNSTENLLEVKNDDVGRLSNSTCYAIKENNKWKIDFISNASSNNYTFIQQ